MWYLLPIPCFALLLILTLIRNRRALFPFAAFGLFAFMYFIPYVWQSIFVNAYDLRELRQEDVYQPSPLLTIAFIPATFFAVYGLLLTSPIMRNAGWFIKFGIFGGFASYALSDLGHKGRDFLLQYVLLAAFYYWLYGSTWSKSFTRKAKVIFLATVLFGTLVVGTITIQRFGANGLNLGIQGGTMAYAGEQVYVFVENTAEADPKTSQETSREMFPLYFTLFNGERQLDLQSFLNSRSERYQYSFGTFLANFYQIGGWTGVCIFVVLFALVFTASLYLLSKLKRAIGYTLLLLLYYQFMFQGAFYWVMYGRSGNVYICSMILGSIICAVTVDVAGRRSRNC